MYICPILVLSFSSSLTTDVEKYAQNNSANGLAEELAPSPGVRRIYIFGLRGIRKRLGAN